MVNLKLITIVVSSFILIITLGNVQAQVGGIQPPVLTPITQIDETTVQLRWIEPNDTRQILQYEIHRDDGSGPILLNIVSVGTTSYQDTGLSPGTYSYHMISVTRTEKSIPSNIETITISKPEPKPLPPKVELDAEFIGKAILVKWKLPINETTNTLAYKWVLQRDLDGSGFVDIAFGERDPDNKPLEPDGREVNFFLDKIVQRGSTYTYKIFFISVDGSQTNESDATTSITIGKDEFTINIATGNLLLTTRTIVPQQELVPLKVLFDSFFDIFQDTYAQTSGLEPIATSSLNPKDESYLFALTPVPNPDTEVECSEFLEILYKPSDKNGQKFTVYATIWENQTIVRNQYLYENIVPSDKRIFNDMYLIPNEEQAIQNYENLEVQLDIDSSDDLNPLNWRQLSIYQVNLYIPQVNQGC